MGYPLECLACSPWGDNIYATCKSNELEPIQYGYPNLDRFEIDIAQLLPEYLKVREELKLKEALWRYWIARTSAIGTNLPIFHSGLELVSKAWYKTTKSKTRGVYLDKKEFEQLLEPEIQMLKTKLSNIPYGQRMLNKIQTAFNMTGNEQLYNFFEEINLSLGELENEAFKGRNIMAHGSANTDIYKAIRITRTYETLFHRVILKLLGYKGAYVDRTIQGWPNRNLGSDK